MSLKKQLNRLFAWYFTLRGEMYRYLGNRYYNVWAYRMAVEDFTTAILHAPDYGRPHYNRGILYWRELQEPERAVRDLTCALEYGEKEPEVYFNRGLAYMEMGNYEASRADLEKYLEVGQKEHWLESARSILKELEEHRAQKG